MLRRLFLSLLLLLAVSAPMAPGAAAARQALSATQKKECIVYVTRTGRKYHMDDCRYLRQSKIATTRTEALQRGLTPCSVCGGSRCDLK
jgi:hypothetical protein